MFVYPNCLAGQAKTVAKIGHGKKTADRVLGKIAVFLDCKPDKLYWSISDNFERIHPFQDDNGRVGRLIALKECLRYNIIPFIIEDSKKMFYYRGLSEWETEKGYLTDNCLDGQDSFKKLMAMFDIQA